MVWELPGIIFPILQLRNIQIREVRSLVCIIEVIWDFDPKFKNSQVCSLLKWEVVRDQNKRSCIWMKGQYDLREFSEILDFTFYLAFISESTLRKISSFKCPIKVFSFLFTFPHLQIIRSLHLETINTFEWMTVVVSIVWTPCRRILMKLSWSKAVFLKPQWIKLIFRI